MCCMLRGVTYRQKEVFMNNGTPYYLFPLLMTLTAHHTSTAVGRYCRYEYKLVYQVSITVLGSICKVQNKKPWSQKCDRCICYPVSESHIHFYECENQIFPLKLLHFQLISCLFICNEPKTEICHNPICKHSCMSLYKSEWTLAQPAGQFWYSYQSVYFRYFAFTFSLLSRDLPYSNPCL
jgi:hypothetical protein